MPLTQVHNSLLGQPVNHNILINPSFTVFQRAGTTDSGAWGVDHDALSHGPDRWVLESLDKIGGSMAESTTIVDPATGINKLVVKHDGAEQENYVYQHIEAVNVLGLYGKEMTFSFSYSDTGGSGIPLAQIESYDSSGNSKALFEAVPTSLGNNRWTCTATITTNDGTLPDLTEKGMSVLIHPNEKNVAPNEWSVWETKLEVGSVATPFIARSYSEELALCQRYYSQIFYQYEGVTGLVGNAAPHNPVLPVTMRAAGMITHTNVASGGEVTGILSSNVKAYGLNTVFVVINTSGTGYGYYIADLAIDAEL
jgi:hypothetical protein